MVKGRPRKTIDDLPKNWRDKIFAYAKQGGTDGDIRAALGISPGLWYALLAREPEFWRVVRKADEIRFAWWLRQGRSSARRPGFNGTKAIA